MAEVRTNAAGIPGNLLGMIRIDSMAIARNSQNYADLSKLDILLTAGIDYFIVMYAPSASEWGVNADSQPSPGRSVVSSDGGRNWSNTDSQLQINPVEYSNVQTSGQIATYVSLDLRDVFISNQFRNSNCQLMMQLTPAGSNPVSGTIMSRVWVDGAVSKYMGVPYVQRHYEIAPATSITTSTGRVTLYFLQSEFNACNNVTGNTLFLPVGPTDAAGKSNLRVGRFAGLSNDNSGLATSYSAAFSLIDPADNDIIWNPSFNRWEVSFNTTGFGGFILEAAPSVLPVLVEYFRGSTLSTSNILNWKMNCINSAPVFNIQRSSNGIDFKTMGRIKTTKDSCSIPSGFKDENPLPGNNYYRIAMEEANTSVVYTDIILLRNAVERKNSLYPTMIEKSEIMSVIFSGIKGSLDIIDGTGKVIFRKSLVNGTQKLQPNLQSKTIYFFRITDQETVLSQGKIFVK